MSIAALPKSTTRLLTSSQVLTTPASLIKELVDNSLDARATSINISISSNTVDIIEVRDNGHGIQPDDRAVLGRRGWTSKITCLEDLKHVSSLGFRGEALGSAIEMASEVWVGTRVEGENFAVSGRLERASGITEYACRPMTQP
jgi:DNA mismatch repair ATPase MutL